MIASMLPGDAERRSRQRVFEPGSCSHTSISRFRVSSAGTSDENTFTLPSFHHFGKRGETDGASKPQSNHSQECAHNANTTKVSQIVLQLYCSCPTCQRTGMHLSALKQVVFTARPSFVKIVDSLHCLLTTSSFIILTILPGTRG